MTKKFVRIIQYSVTLHVFYTTKHVPVVFFKDLFFSQVLVCL